MTPNATPRPVEILLVEDNPGDARLTQEALRDAKLCHRLSFVTNGEEALSYLRGEQHHADATRPDLLLLDLHLPRKDGWEVVAEMTRDERLCRIPVAILAGVPEEWGEQSGPATIACTLVKPLDADQIQTLTTAAARLGLQIVTVSDSCDCAISA